MFKKRSLTIVLALTAGMFGGFLSRCITPPFVYGQAQTSDTVEVRAQRFSIIDPEGHVVGTFTGTFTKEPLGKLSLKIPRIALVDGAGRELWSADGSNLKTLSLK
jgi:hypothetical protein